MATEFVRMYCRIIFMVDLESILFVLCQWQRNDSFDILGMSVVVTAPITYYSNIYDTSLDIGIFALMLSTNYEYSRSILSLDFKVEWMLTTLLCSSSFYSYLMGCSIVIFSIWTWGKYIITQFLVQGVLLNGLWNSFKYIALSTEALHCWLLILHNSPIINSTVKLSHIPSIFRHRSKCNNSIFYSNESNLYFLFTFLIYYTRSICASLKS